MELRVLVVAAHPDDECLGCGGTIAAHTARGHSVDVVFLADGETAREEGTDGSVAERQKAAQRSCRALGANAPYFMDFPDNRLDSVPLLDIVKKLEASVRELSPEIVYTHHGGDLNVDHELAHRAVLTACRPVPDSVTRAIYTFEVLSSTGWNSGDLDAGFRATRYVDVTDTMNQKLEAIRCYSEELREFPHPRSLDAVNALAKLRGAQAGLEMAEGFGVVRQIGIETGERLTR